MKKKHSSPHNHRAMAEMQRLVDKYPDGFEGFERQMALGSLSSILALPRAKSSSDIPAAVKEAKEPSYQVREMGSIPVSNGLTVWSGVRNQVSQVPTKQN
jgi:hypothetical protein